MTAHPAIHDEQEQTPHLSGHRAGGWAFRPDIEGLRAVAIVLVVLYHASIGPFGGGYVGVDVFYVISGFLITGLLVREAASTGTISLAAFYARRARRLLPAAALVLFVTLVASVLVLPPLLVPGVAADTAAAALYVANIRFAAQATDYFASAAAPSPVLHYWSLGVEEQFYLLWPAIVLLAVRGVLAVRGASILGQRGPPGWRRYVTGRVAVVAAALGIASFALSLWLTMADAPLAFFLLPSRAWELALGALLALAGSRLARVPEPVATVAGWAGLALICLAAVAVTDATPFPGLAALLPTVGAACVIAAGARPARGAAAGLLATRVPRLLGRISYSLYLWHWPVLVLPASATGAPLPLAARVTLVAVAVALAALTLRFVEDPFRHGRMARVHAGRSLAGAGLLAVVVALVSLGSGAFIGGRLSGASGQSNAALNARQLDRLLGQLRQPASAPSSAPAPGPRATVPGGTPAPSPSATLPSLPSTPGGPVPADLQPAIGAAPEDYPVTFPDGCNVSEGERASRGSCLYGDLRSRTTIALFGDSHAAFWFPAVLGFAEREGWRVLNLTMSSCTPADLPVYNAIFKRVYAECPAWRSQAIARLVATRPAVILVAGTHGITPVDASGRLLPGPAIGPAWEAGMIRTLDRLTPAAGRVILLADTPTSQVDPPTCLSQHPDDVLACATPVSRAVDLPWLAAERDVVARTGASFIDPTWWVCPTSPCPAVIGNLLVYQNAGHLTATFAAALADRLGAAVIAAIRTRA